MPASNHSDNLFDAQAPQTDEEKLWDLLSLYVDGEADPAQAAIVEQMLSSDPAYRRDFDFLMQASKTMHTLEEVAPPIALRDAIYAGTVRRPTLAGRLRAAWNYATTPAAGRYATVGGAFAVAAIGALLVLPRLSPTNSRSTNPTTAAANSPSSSPFRVTISVPDPSVAKLEESKVGPKPPLPFKMLLPTDLVYHKPNIRPNRIPTISLILHPHSDRSASAFIKAPPLPSNHYLPKNNAPHTGGVQIVGLGPSYQYDKKMDEHTAPHPPMTIVPPAMDDFGPMLTANDTPTSDNVVKPTADMGTSGGEGPAPQPAPKTTVHVATLPPGASQNIAAAVIRRNMIAKYSGYDRNVAENIQRHEVTIDVIKGTF